MDLVIDSDVQIVAEFMQQQIPASKLVGVAGALADIAPLLWGRFESEPIKPLQLVPASITACAQRIQPCAIE